MCGIVGFAGRPVGGDPINLLRRQAATLRHRGPDQSGEWLGERGQVGLAHCRLSILDLSEAGRQPMRDASSGLRVIFNGEIYNHHELREELMAQGHRFHSRSDTEVILESYRAWGRNCVERFNGMFAFAIYDAQRRSLFLARDRAGEKPLFYHHAPGRLRFASELKALFVDHAFPRRLDLRALEHYLAFGYVPGELCMVAGVRKLLPGHAMAYDLDTDHLVRWRYWSLPAPTNCTEHRGGELVDKLEVLLRDAVRRQLAADVPVGVLLSGGIDSSLVTALAASVSDRPVKTFTISFPGHGRYNESSHARLVAEHFGTEHIELAAEPATHKLLPTLAQQYDEPIADSSMIPTYLVSRLVREHATVALGGDGGDELFGGYYHHSWIQNHHRLRRTLPMPLRNLLGGIAARLPIGMRGRNYLIGMSGDLAESVAHVNRYFDERSRERLLRPANSVGATGGIHPERHKASLFPPGWTPLQGITAVDFQTYLVDDILVKVDRASMLASLEVRAPFLDHRVVEFAFGQVPDNLRATAGDRKILPRMLARRLLPPELDLDRKQGFSLPLDAWFRGEWGDYIGGILYEAPQSLFDKGMIRSLLDAQRRGYSNTQRLYALAIFELWRRAYDIGLP